MSDAREIMNISGKAPLRALLTAGLAVILCAQNVPTFRTAVFLAHVDAEVLGQNRRPLNGFTKDDFLLLDGGQQQTIAAFSAEEQPLDLILLFDVGCSMRGKLKKIAAAAQEALQELRQGDRVSIMAFASDSSVAAPFSGDFAEASRTISGVLTLRSREFSHIQDAVCDAANHFRDVGDNPEHQRRVVLVITDDIGVRSREKIAVIESLWEADCLVSGLIVSNRLGPKGLFAPLGATRASGLQDLVEATGGDMIHSDDLSTSFPEMMHRLRNRYTLFYKLSDAKVGSLRKIDVQLSARGYERFPGARVIAPRAYRLRERDRYGFVAR